MWRQWVVFVYRKLEGPPHLVPGPGEDHLRHALRVTDRLEQGDGALDVLHNGVARRLERKGGVRLRRHVRHHRVPFHVPGLDVLDALPHIPKAGMGQLLAQQCGVGGRRHVQSRDVVAENQQRSSETGAAEPRRSGDEDGSFRGQL